MPLAEPIAEIAPFSGPAARIDDLADQCVQCGLCLPHCPTYRIGGNEAESPRGRIALARALANDTLPASPTATRHLDQCLSCMSCERVCPSNVEYGALLHAVRSLRPVASDSLRFLMPWLERPHRLRLATRVNRLLRAELWLPGALRRWAPKSLLARIGKEMPPAPPSIALAEVSRPTATPRSRVALLLGCVASAFDRDTHAATLRLLTALGHEVVIPPGQGCCGGLARHAGENAVAARLAAPTRDALLAAKPDVVLVSASGCFETLRDLTLAGSGVAVCDALSFVAADSAFDTLVFEPLPRKAALHLPCTQVGIAGSVAATKKLLARIPNLSLVGLDEQPRCCGAAGSYFLDHPHIAEPLRAEKLAQIAKIEPDIVLSANIGCRLYLGNGLRQQGSSLKVVHPLTVLAQQLKSA